MVRNSARLNSLGFSRCGGPARKSAASTSNAALGPEIAGTDEAVREWREARELGLAITVHMGGNGHDSAARGLAVLERHGLLGPETTYIHPNYFTDDALRRIAATGGTASIAPISETGLSIGYPATGRLLRACIPTSLSTDTVTSGPGDMFSVMRSAYLFERARGGMDFTTRDVLRLATVDGARVLGLAEVTGSLRPGKQADLLVLSTDRLGLAAHPDLIASVVLSAGPAVVEMVLVGGAILKRNGQLLQHDSTALRAKLRESARRTVLRADPLAADQGDSGEGYAAMTGVTRACPVSVPRTHPTTVRAIRAAGALPTPHPRPH